MIERANASKLTMIALLREDERAEPLAIRAIQLARALEIVVILVPEGP
jgi:hypothetical protein